MFMGSISLNIDTLGESTTFSEKSRYRTTFSGIFPPSTLKDEKSDVKDKTIISVITTIPTNTEATDAPNIFQKLILQIIKICNAKVQKNSE